MCWSLADVRPGFISPRRWARQGCRTLVIEKDGEEALGRRYDIFHLSSETFSRFGVPRPQPGDVDFVRTFGRKRIALRAEPLFQGHAR